MICNNTVEVCTANRKFPQEWYENYNAMTVDNLNSSMEDGEDRTGIVYTFQLGRDWADSTTKKYSISLSKGVVY